MGLAPSTREYKIAYEELEQRYKDMNSRWRGRIKEYEQPSELQQIAGSGVAGEDLVTTVIANLGGMKSIPAWIRPFIPAVQNWIKENPETVKTLIQRFTQGGGRGESLNTDSL
jgi:hypothetical protein